MEKRIEAYSKSYLPDLWERLKELDESIILFVLINIEILYFLVIEMKYI